MRVGVIADDFTGASDIGNTLAKGLPGEGGLRTALVLGVPAEGAAPDAEACVVALKTRSAPAAEAVSRSLEALRWLRAQGCRQVVFKVCSTFDSTPAGNIGPVAEALADALGAAVAPVCPAFPGAGRTVYQGHLFVHDRPLHESGMEHHPLNPMTDADLRRWLARQATAPVGHVPWQAVREGADRIAVGLDGARSRGERLVVVDALTDGDLVAIGRACAAAPLLVGGSGIALGLPGNLVRAGLGAGGPAPAPPGVDGPGAILAGSCSGATRGQVERHKASHPTLAVDADAVVRGETTPGEVAGFLLSHAGAAPLAFSSGTPDEVRRVQARHGRERVAEALDALFAGTARALVAAGVRRLVVAGGETSGAVASALDLGPLAIGPEIDPGVPTLVSGGATPVGLALKSGNFGAPDFFAKALDRLAGR